VPSRRLVFGLVAILTWIMGGFRLQADRPAPRKELLLVFEPGEGQLHIIDPTVPAVTRSLSAETNGSAVAAFGDRVYFVDPHEIIVSLDTRTGVESTLGHLPDVYRGHLPWPFSLAVSPRGDRLVVAHSGVTGPGNVAEVGTFWLSVLEPRTGALLS
jgi:hypothetical protein